MYNQTCSCGDTSDTEGSDAGYGESCCATTSGDECPCNGQETNGQMNFNGQQQNGGSVSRKTSRQMQNGEAGQKRLSGSMQPPQTMSQERRTSQPRLSGGQNGNSVPGCTCMARQGSANGQQRSSQQNSRPGSVSSQQRTSFQMKNGPPMPPEYRMPQGPDPNSFPPMDFQQGMPPQMGYPQTNCSGQPRMSTGSNQRGSQSSVLQQLAQQNGNGKGGCNAPVCQAGRGSQTVRRASQTSTGSNGSKQQLLPPNTPPGMDPGMFDPNQFAKMQQQQQPGLSQQIAPCCLPSMLKKNSSLSAQENVEAPPPPPVEGGLCFCPDNPGPPPPDNQDCLQDEPLSSPGSDTCQSCAEFEPQPEPEPEPVQEPEPECTCNNTGGEEEVLTGCPEEVEKPATPQNGKNQNGFWQQVQFQICQQVGGGNDGSQDESKIQNQSANLEEPPPSAEGDCCAGNNGNGAKNEENITQMQDASNGSENKSGGKSWQQLTLDIFQSQDGPPSGGEGHDNPPQQGWQQQLRLSIYQEKYDNGNGMTTTTNFSNNGNGNGSQAEKMVEELPPPSNCG